ncbi:MAG: AAA family ATPase [Crocinitomicaceae bacterium]|nr:AAA family ATPase [Crocinitomicaceae bacterium]
MSKTKFVVGITGGSGVGKTTLIRKLYNEFPNRVTTFSLDNYYKPKHTQAKDENGIINFDLPTALDTANMEQDLLKLAGGEAIQQKIYAFNNPSIEEEFQRLEPKELLLVEGLFVMHYDFLKPILDYTVYLKVDQELQLKRRLKRDVEERNYSYDDVMYQWENHVIPSYANYVLPYREDSDLIITNNSTFDDNIHTLMQVIHQNID